MIGFLQITSADHTAETLTLLDFVDPQKDQKNKMFDTEYNPPDKQKLGYCIRMVKMYREIEAVQVFTDSTGSELRETNQ